MICPVHVPDWGASPIPWGSLTGQENIRPILFFSHGGTGATGLSKPCGNLDSSGGSGFILFSWLLTKPQTLRSKLLKVWKCGKLLYAMCIHCNKRTTLSPKRLNAGGNYICNQCQGSISRQKALKDLKRKRPYNTCENCGVAFATAEHYRCPICNGVDQRISYIRSPGIICI